MILSLNSINCDNNEPIDRTVFFISDGTAITAEVLGHAVLSQFPLSFISYTLPFLQWKEQKK